MSTARACLIAVLALASVILTAPHPAARAADLNPLQIPDASSPRAALQNFLASTDSIYTRWAAVLTNYLDGGTLYLTPDQRQVIRSALRDVPNATRIVDLSDVPPILRSTLAQERTLQFREILDRIALPDPADIPDAAAMAGRTDKRWRLPGTEIEFTQVKQGPREGDYVLSASTVDRLPQFYELVKDLPYRPGAGATLIATYRRFDPNSTATIYELFTSSPAGLAAVLPMRWLLSWPDWMRARIGGATIWQWTGIAIGAVIVVLAMRLSHRFSRRLAAEPEDSRWHRWHLLPVPACLLILAGLFVPGMCALLRIGDTPRIALALLETAVFFIALAWLALAAGAIIGELIADSETMGARSLDRQLVRLVSRLAGMVVAVACLVQGADQLGIPAYSVLAGLGVGGLAVALAAKDSIANLLGSMLIMFEKPFRVGHQVRLGGHEGTVEDVGFRSTRIRTPDNSLISIPNDSVINTTVENLTLRSRRRERFTIGITYDTPRETLEAFVEHVQRLIEDHPLTAKDGIQVSLNALSESSLDILVIFHLAVTDYTAELQGRHDVLLRIIALAEEMGVAFAYPTRTLLVEGSGNAPVAGFKAVAAV